MNNIPPRNKDGCPQLSIDAMEKKGPHATLEVALGGGEPISNQDLVSVVLTVYAGDDNHDLQLALQSVFHQTYQPYELIIVVDGAVDQEKRVLLRETESRSGVKVLWLDENRGPAAARNAGIRVSNGKYVAIMDADDINHEDRLQIQKAHIENHDLDVVSSSVDIIDRDGNVIGERTLPSSGEAIRRLAPYSCPLNNPAVFGKTDLLKAHPFDEDFRVSEDYDLWVRLLHLGARFGNTAQKTLFYRQTGSTLSRRRGWEYAWADLRVKWNAKRLVAWQEKPQVCALALVAALIRCLPIDSLFGFIYAFKQAVFSRVFSDDRG